jgi:hypothetical protein
MPTLEMEKGAGSPEGEIWKRLLKPDKPGLSKEAAKSLLNLAFSTRDRKRMNELSAKARKGTLTPAEDAELEAYIHVGFVLSMLQSKARVCLRKNGKSGVKT